MSSPRTLYEILDLPPDASGTDVEAGFRRAMEAFSDDALATYALYGPDEADQVRKEIQLAYEVLSHAPSRSAYDAALANAADKAEATLSFTARWEAPSSGSTSISDGRMDTEREDAAPPREEAPPKRSPSGRLVMIASPVEDMPDEREVKEAPAELAPLPPAGPPAEPAGAPVPSSIPISMTPTEPPAPAEPTPVRFRRVHLDDDSVAMTASRPADRTPAPAAAVPPVLALSEDGEVNGSVLQRLREARGITVKQLSEITKVSVHYLKAMEANAFSELPTRVYLRGFLIQYARALKVSPERLANGYLAFADRYRSQLR